MNWRRARLASKPSLDHRWEFGEFRVRDRADRWLQAVERRLLEQRTFRSAAVAAGSSSPKGDRRVHPWAFPPFFLATRPTNGRRREISLPSSIGTISLRWTRAPRPRTPLARSTSPKSKTNWRRIGALTECSAIRPLAGRLEHGRVNASRRHRGARWWPYSCPS